MLREVSPPSLGQHSLHLSVLHDLWSGHSLRNLVAAALCYICSQKGASEFPSHSSTVPCQHILASWAALPPVRPPSSQYEGRKRARAVHQSQCGSHLTWFSSLKDQCWLPVVQWLITTASYVAQFPSLPREGKSSTGSLFFSMPSTPLRLGNTRLLSWRVKHQTLWAYNKCSWFKHLKETL